MTLSRIATDMVDLRMEHRRGLGHRARQKYCLRCVRCNWVGDEDHYQLYCPTCGPDAFLRTEYVEPPPEPSGHEAAFYSYAAYLPTARRYGTRGPMIGCIRADELGEELGLRNLWLLLSGYAPEHEAHFVSGSFKEVEALAVMARVQEQTEKVLIVSSAGNAGRAFLEIASKYGIPAVVVVPEAVLPSLCVSELPRGNGPLLIALKDAFYPDAIQFVAEMQDRFSKRLIREGGCYNIARRDAIGLLMHRVVRKIGRIPDHYVQAVGSGTGAIAAWEATTRLATSGRYGKNSMKLHLVQNIPFTPMVDAWYRRARHLEPLSRHDIRDRLSQTYARVLSNATPPYSVSGGIYDALVATNGEMYGVSNDKGMAAAEVFIEHTGVVPCPEAAVALAGLQLATRESKVAADDCVVLHITGAGWDRIVREYGKVPYPPAECVSPDGGDEVADHIDRYLDRALTREAVGRT